MTHFHLVPRVRMSAAVPLFLQTLMACTDTTLPLPLIHMYYINILAII